MWLFAETSTAAQDGKAPSPQPHCQLTDMHAERSVLTITFHPHHTRGSRYHSLLHLIEKTEARGAAMSYIRPHSEEAGARTDTSPPETRAFPLPMSLLLRNPVPQIPLSRNESVRHSSGSYSSPHLMN